MTPLSETKRIRWEPTGYPHGWTGHVGTLKPWVFQIHQPAPARQGWVLTATFPGALNDVRLGADPDALKAEAEHWLEEFTSSIGAVFPDTLRFPIERERDTCREIAAQREAEGREMQAERLSKYADGLDRALALIDTPVQSPETAAQAEKE